MGSDLGLCLDLGFLKMDCWVCVCIVVDVWVCVCCFCVWLTRKICYWVYVLAGIGLCLCFCVWLIRNGKKMLEHPDTCSYI